jgi:hypothetical protein
MAIRNLFKRPRRWARDAAHYGRLGKVAAHRFFLRRERNKLLIKLGEKAATLVRSGKIKTPELKRLVDHVGKIDQLLRKKDYGGEDGIKF